MAPSCRQSPLQGIAAQSVVRKLAVVGPMRSASDSKRSSHSSSSTSAEINTSAPSFVSPRATPAPDIPGPALIAPPIAAPAPAPADNLFRQFMQAYMEDRRPLIPVQALALVEPKE